jgi:hypothetical protein
MSSMTAAIRALQQQVDAKRAQAAGLAAENRALRVHWLTLQLLARCLHELHAHRRRFAGRGGGAGAGGAGGLAGAVPPPAADECGEDASMRRLGVLIADSIPDGAHEGRGSETMLEGTPHLAAGRSLLGLER